VDTGSTKLILLTRTTACNFAVWLIFKTPWCVVTIAADLVSGKNKHRIPKVDPKFC